MHYTYSAALMIENNKGMTKTCNRFYESGERDPRIAELRWLHAAMDRAVPNIDGWDDIATDCELLLDYEIDEETWGRKKRPWRYCRPDMVRKDVLACPLALDAQLARGERKRGA